ncbi:hypothetical protein EDB92DRAFT_1816392 [Lactarius akahatsu]|uniref:DUF6535 domain-containing protein n=1 Tax=Lactarius akahatsu TaxID=416441 RepID=A0AAD4LHL0_9AGAM|nr:hypothetical protein EDB92DRAFT_1816392 [Lactarius akahatsu]
MHAGCIDFPSRCPARKPPPPVKCNDTVTPEKAAYTVSSEAIFSIYLTHAQKLDEDNVENWKDVADRILFAGLLATVAIFIAISYPNSQQDPNIITQSLLVLTQQTLDDQIGAKCEALSRRDPFRLTEPAAQTA